MKLLDLLKDYELTGNSLILEDLEESKEKTTASGIILTTEEGKVPLKKAKVLKAGKGYTSEYGKWIENKVKDNALVYYKNAAKYDLEGIEFKGTEVGQVVAYRNETNELGQEYGGRV